MAVFKKPLRFKNGEKCTPILAVCTLTHRRETTQPQTGQNSKTIRDLTHLCGTRRAKTGQQIESKHDLTHRCDTRRAKTGQYTEMLCRTRGQASRDLSIFAEIWG